MILSTFLTCPSCGTAKKEPMPTDACQFFYVCTGCGTRLKPKVRVSAAYSALMVMCHAPRCRMRGIKINRQIAVRSRS